MYLFVFEYLLIAPYKLKQLTVKGVDLVFCNRVQKSMKEQRLNGMESIAAYMERSVSTVQRLRRRPEGQFIQVGSCGPGITEYGRAAFSYPSSLDAVKPIMQARTSEIRRQAGAKRRTIKWL